MDKKIIFGVIIFLFAFSTNAYAQTPTTSAEANITPTATRAPIRQQLNNIKDAAKEKVDAMRALNEEKMQSFKDKIAAIKDTNKKTIVERINNNITAKNAKFTGSMNDTLMRLETIIEKLKERSANITAQGKDASALDAAIASAESAITSAKTAVTAQSEKTYTANFTTDAGIRSAISQMVTQFRKDITATFKLVTAAKQAVMKALSEASKVRGDKTATDSAKI